MTKEPDSRDEPDEPIDEGLLLDPSGRGLVHRDGESASVAEGMHDATDAHDAAGASRTAGDAVERDDDASTAAAKSKAASRIAWVGVALGLLSSICYATVNALLRDIAGSIDPYVGALLRQVPLLAALLIGALVLRPVALRPGHEGFVGPRVAAGLFGAGIVALFIGNAILFYSLEWVGLGVSTAGYLGGLLLGSAIISWIFLKERPSAWQFVGMAGIAVGLWFTSQAAPPLGVSAWLTVLGFVLAVVTGVCYAISNTASRAAQRTPGRFISTLGLMTLGAVVALFVFLLIRDGFDLGVTFGSLTPYQLWIVLLAGLVNGAALGSITVAVKFATATTVSMLNSLVLVFGIIFGFIFFDEPITAPLAIGAGLILAGVIVGQLQGRRRGRGRPEPAHA